ncbi:MAG: hypothetical protein JWO15_3621 [Sphingomonadales bacterium]|nr:hypothetical protein [Sphingomonadales bacterium]
MAHSRLYYNALHEIVFSSNYPGYRPTVKEIPNGDGKVDADKRFAHIAEKYLKDYGDEGAKKVLNAVLDEAHSLALKISRKLAVPEQFLPVRSYSNMRVLEYPVGAVSNLHTDFDLFTIMFYRDQPDCFVTQEKGLWNTDKDHTMQAWCNLDNARELNPQLHLGEMAEIIGLGPATPHEVVASKTPQHSIVYFAIPDHKAVLPNGMTVGDWLVERMSRSRTGWTPVAYG